MERLKADERKSGALRAKGVRLIRLRDERLPRVADDRTVVFHARVHKPDIDTLLQGIPDAVPEIGDAHRDTIAAYVRDDRYQNGDEYLRLCTMLSLPRPEESLENNDKRVADEWNYVENYPLTPSHVRWKSNLKFWFHCPTCGSDYKAKVCHRSEQHSGCPYCGHRKVRRDWSLAALHPELIKELHPTLNAGIDPYRLSPRSNRGLTWMCPNGHVYRAPANRRVGTFLKTGKYSGCVVCFRSRGRR